MESGRDCGGPKLLLLHGVADSGATWRRVLPLLDGFHVVAPDLLGHGASAKPATDYSVPALAAHVRDLALAIGFDRATVVGHSLGGGIAMQYAYLFPPRVERLVLVSSGGFGKQAALPLRVATLPGLSAVLGVLTSRPVRQVAGGLLRAARLDRHPAARYAGRQLDVLSGEDARRALTTTLRGVMGLGGQRLVATDRLYLAEDLPVLFIVSRHDRFIPAKQSVWAHSQVGGSRLEIFEGTSHYPHLSEPERFAAVLTQFILGSVAARLGDHTLRRRLLGGPQSLGLNVPRQHSVAGDAGVIRVPEPDGLG